MRYAMRPLCVEASCNRGLNDADDSTGMCEMKKRTFFLCTLIFIMQIGSAYAYEPSQASAYYLAFKKDVERLIGGENIDENRKKLICSMTAAGGQMFRQEKGKLKYNNLFQNLRGEGQAEDIQKLEKELSSRRECEKNIRIWNAYDEKWYAESRAHQVAEKEAREKAWAAQIKDTGADVWDGVINGTFFSIPREHIWFDRNKADGYSGSLNIQVRYPEISSTTIQKEADWKEYVRHTVGGLLNGFSVRTFPCDRGDNEKKPCNAYTYQIHFWKFLNCKTPSEITLNKYEAVWLGQCAPKTTPVFDKDVGMWRIGMNAYYEGSPEFPSYWLICHREQNGESEENSKSCESAVAINDAVYFKYSFSRELFAEHRKIHDQIRVKIQNWIVRSN